jgi:hypothetical protein
VPRWRSLSTAPMRSWTSMSDSPPATGTVGSDHGSTSPTEPWPASTTSSRGFDHDPRAGSTISLVAGATHPRPTRVGARLPSAEPARLLGSAHSTTGARGIGLRWSCSRSDRRT